MGGPRSGGDPHAFRRTSRCRPRRDRESSSASPGDPEHAVLDCPFAALRRCGPFRRIRMCRPRGRVRSHPDMDEGMGVRLFIGIVLALALSALAGCGPTDEDPLSLFAGVGSERAGEVLLEWTGGPPGVPHWQYRCRSFGGWASGDGTCGQGNVHAPEWGEWRDIQRKRTRITRHRVTGLTPGVFYEFQVRPRSEDGRNAPSEPAEVMAHPVGFDGVVHAIHGRLLEVGARSGLATPTSPSLSRRAAVGEGVRARSITQSTVGPCASTPLPAGSSRDTRQKARRTELMTSSTRSSRRSGSSRSARTRR